MSREAGRKPPWGHIAADLFDFLTSVEVDEVDWKLHKEGVHRFTGYDPQALIGGKARVFQQPLASVWASVSNLDALGE